MRNIEKNYFSIVVNYSLHHLVCNSIVISTNIESHSVLHSDLQDLFRINVVILLKLFLTEKIKIRARFKKRLNLIVTIFNNS